MSTLLTGYSINTVVGVAVYWWLYSPWLFTVQGGVCFCVGRKWAALASSVHAPFEPLFLSERLSTGWRWSFGSHQNVPQVLRSSVADSWWCWHHPFQLGIFRNHMSPVLSEDWPIVRQSGVVRDWEIDSFSSFLSTFSRAFPLGIRSAFSKAKSKLLFLYFLTLRSLCRSSSLDESLLGTVLTCLILCCWRSV